MAHAPQVLFALHDAALLSGMDLHGVTTKSVEPIHTGSSKVDIFLELFEAPDGSVLGHVEYDSSLWQKASIQSFVTAFHVSFILASHTFSSLSTYTTAPSGRKLPSIPL